jgi:hypothetical protein
MKHARKLWAVLLLGVLAAAVAVGIVAAQDRPVIVERMPGRANQFVRALDTLCAAVGDTTEGPSVYCFGARQVIFRIQANSGTCSLFTVQVSNNDTTWQAAAAGNQMDVGTDFNAGDSLNTGGETIVLWPDLASTATAEGGLMWRYARVFTRQRTGYTTTTASAGPTVACRTRADSLRFRTYVQWTAP